MNLKLASVIFLIVFLAGCVGADLGYVSMKANKVQVGYTREQVVDIMGTPDRTWINPQNRDITYSHYCIFGVAAEDDNGFFFHKNKVFRKIKNISRETASVHGVYTTPDGMYWNCSGDVRVYWARTPEPPQLIAEKREAERVRQAREAERGRQAREAERVRQAREESFGVIDQEPSQTRVLDAIPENDQEPVPDAAAPSRAPTPLNAIRRPPRR